MYNNYYLTGLVLHIDPLGLKGIKFVFTPIISTSGNVIKCEETYKYLFVPSKLIWQEANDYCLSKYRTYLATIITDADIAIAQYLQNSEVYGKDELWVGLTDSNNEGIWIWIDGTSCNYTQSGLCIDDKHWEDNEPNDAGQDGEDHAELSTDGNFNDDNRDFNMFLCNNPLYPGVVTFSATFNPTIDPTADPTLYPTRASTVAVFITKLSDEVIVISVLGPVLVILFFVLLAWCYFRRKRKKDEAKTIWMKNPMIIAVVIAYYDEDNEDCEVHEQLKDLDGIQQDYIDTYKLFVDTLNYTIFPHYDIDNGIIKEDIQKYWTLEELKQFLDERAQDFGG